MVRKLAKKWVGTRRTARRVPQPPCLARTVAADAQRASPDTPRARSVRAETEVTAVELRRREMQWVLDNDESLQDEVMGAVGKRQEEIAAARAAAAAAATKRRQREAEELAVSRLRANQQPSSSS